MSPILDVRYRLNSCRIGVGLVILSMLVCRQSFAESTAPPIDDRCENLQSIVSFDERALESCNNELNSCIDERLSQHGEQHDQARTHCWDRPLDIDPRFVGPCPSYMEQFETHTNGSDESRLQRIAIRRIFKQSNNNDSIVDWFKRSESEQTIRRMLTSDPENPVLLDLLISSLFVSNDLVERLNLHLTKQELDPDCPESRSLFLFTIYGITNEVVDNWLTGKGSGSELSKTEITDLFLRVQRTLLEAYDLTIEQAENERKLKWALESIHDALLSRPFENLQQFARLTEIGLDEFGENRRTFLTQQFSREYDVDSDHGRAQSLRTICSSRAFELGLLDHCLKLLVYFGLEDSNSLDSPELDWTQAAISLMNGLTRDCSEHTNDLLFAPEWWNKRHCFAERHHEITSRINDLLERFPELGRSAERQVLEAYLLLDETSDERFLQALTLDGAMVVYAARLSKRLHKLGKVETASNILINIEPENNSQFSSAEKNLLIHTSNSIKEGTYRNWNESAVDFQSSTSPH